MRAWLLLLSFVLVALGCKASGPARSPAVTDGDNAQVLKNLSSAMTNVGHECVQEGRGLYCDGGFKDRVAFFLAPVQTPVRLIGIVVFAKLKVDCEEALPRMNQLNHDIDTVKVSCDEKGTLMALGSMPVPEAGLTQKDVIKFVESWMQIFVTSAKSYGLVDVMH